LIHGFYDFLHAHLSRFATQKPSIRLFLSSLLVFGSDVLPLFLKVSCCYVLVRLHGLSCSTRAGYAGYSTWYAGDPHPMSPARKHMKTLTHTTVVCVPPSGCCQVVANREGESAEEDGRDEDRVSLEEGVVEHLPRVNDH
jgi:hypothetical protein